MITIPAIQINGSNAPASPIPASARRVIFDGANYIVYEQGDILPAEPAQDPKIAQRAAIDVQRDAKLDAGFDWNGKHWHADNEFQTQLTALIAAFSNSILPATQLVPVRAMDNTIAQLGKADLVSLAGALLQFVQGVFAWSWAEKDKL